MGSGTPGVMPLQPSTSSSDPWLELLLGLAHWDELG